VATLKIEGPVIARRGCRYTLAMPRRSRYDPLATSDRPRWLVAKDMHSAVLGCTMIPAGTDLHGLMAAAIRERQAEGWTAESDGSWGFAFIHRDGARRMVAIVQVDPAEPVAGVYAPRQAPQVTRLSP
jgi:hypothetical protein